MNQELMVEMNSILKEYDITLEYSNDEDFIREFKDSMNWGYISQIQKLSEDFIREFKDSVNWYWISSFQKLSEDFIREFKDSVNWEWISYSQNLSESFIREFKDSVYWYFISKFQKLSIKFMDEFPQINKEIQLKCNHDTRTKDQKLKIMKDYAIQHNLKFENETLYCFREHRRNRGAWNSTIHYDSKGYYSDWHCDLDVDNGASFGLGAWPKGNTPISIHVDDFGCIVKNSSKIRCFGFTII